MSLQLSYIYEGREIEFEVIYKKRKTMSIEVNLEGHVRVITPVNLETKEILNIVKRKSSWICKKQDELIERNTLRKIKNYVTGEKYLYCGKEYILELHQNSNITNPKVVIKNNIISITYKEIQSDVIKSILELWYREKTLEIVIGRIHKYSQFFNTFPKDIKVKQQKRRWASCTYDNKILFNWRIAMAPIHVIDYIVVHEMCHMEFKNHSNNFWNRVKSIMPNYELNQLWLKENGIKLEI